MTLGLLHLSDTVLDILVIVSARGPCHGRIPKSTQPLTPHARVTAHNVAIPDQDQTKTTFLIKFDPEVLERERQLPAA